MEKDLPTSRSALQKAENAELDIPEFYVRLPESRSKIRVGILDLGHTYVDIRKFYEVDGDWKPTSKGISIPLEHFDKVYRKLRRLKMHLDGTNKESSLENKL